MSASRSLWSCRNGSTAAEFAMVLPILLLLLFGIIDAGRFLWEFNRAEKATQMGARYAVVTNPVASGLTSYSFAVEDLIPAGSAIPTANFDEAVCNDETCSCVGDDICSDIGYDETAYSNIVARMAAMYPPIEEGKVTVSYRNVGIGFAGDPAGADVAPLVTVSLNGLTFQPITTLLFGVGFNMPDFRAALTFEDGNGEQSN